MLCQYAENLGLNDEQVVGGARCGRSEGLVFGDHARSIFQLNGPHTG